VLIGSSPVPLSPLSPPSLSVSLSLLSQRQAVFHEEWAALARRDPDAARALHALVPRGAGGVTARPAGGADAVDQLRLSQPQAPGRVPQPSQPLKYQYPPPPSQAAVYPPVRGAPAAAAAVAAYPPSQPPPPLPAQQQWGGAEAPLPLPDWLRQLADSGSGGGSGGGGKACEPLSVSVHLLLLLLAEHRALVQYAPLAPASSPSLSHCVPHSVICCPPD